MQSEQDTIAAIATARGRAALAVVRLSGPEAISIAASCFRGADLNQVASHTAHFGYIRNRDGETIDQVVAIVFRAPRSFTGEDVVEVTCHGGDFASQLILNLFLTSGARMAAPGEFTQRAFLNGKLDLAQAEAVADLIQASSTLAHRVSLQHLQGRYSEALMELRSELLEMAAYVELELDFSDEDVEFAERSRLEALLDRANTILSGLLGSYDVGEIVRDGVRVVIGGRPNAGKSTLLNAFVGLDRAIVTETPGTTRDEIDAETEIEGLLFRFVDTAGLRETTDAIEAEGVRRAERSIRGADLLLYVYDLTLGLDEGEVSFLQNLRATHPQLPILIVGNKEDLVAGAAPPPLEGFDFIPISARQGRVERERIEPLLHRLVREVMQNLSDPDTSPVVINQRHLRHLDAALGAIRSARQALDSGVSGDALSIDLRFALQELGAITGEITNEDVLDQIFSRFCIGK